MRIIAGWIYFLLLTWIGIVDVYAANKCVEKYTADGYMELGTFYGIANIDPGGLKSKAWGVVGSMYMGPFYLSELKPFGAYASGYKLCGPERLIDALSNSQSWEKLPISDRYYSFESETKYNGATGKYYPIQATVVVDGVVHKFEHEVGEAISHIVPVGGDLYVSYIISHTDTAYDPKQKKSLTVIRNALGAGNAPPVATNSTLNISEDTVGVATLTATDLNGDSLNYSVLSQPNSAHGAVTISGNKATFKPKPNWNGTTSFTYRASDGKADSNTATVTITVTPVNDPPSVASATLAINEDTVGSLILDVTDVDLQFEGDSHTWNIVAAPNATHGTASISDNKLIFAPINDWSGSTSLTYRATDLKGAVSNTATITITVTPVNDAPVAHALSLIIDEDTSGVITLQASDIDNEPDFFFKIVTPPPAMAGSAIVQGSILTFKPEANWHGDTSLTYSAMDAKGAWSVPSSIDVFVKAVNDKPTSFGALRIKTHENQSVEIRAKVR